jgi:hypothetical protein
MTDKDVNEYAVILNVFDEMENEQQQGQGKK